MIPDMRGLVMGRFQPFHLGHLGMITDVLECCDEIVVAVTSSQFNYLEKDPFTAGERIEMVHDSLAEAGADMGRCYIIPVENQFNVATWSAYTRSMLPGFERAYSGNGYVSMLLADSGINVVSPRMIKRDKYNATRIRAEIASGGKWGSMVPAAVRRILVRIGAEERLGAISKSDTVPTSH